MDQEMRKNTKQENFWTGHVAWWTEVTRMKVEIRELFKKTYSSMCMRLKALRPKLQILRKKYKDAPHRAKLGRQEIADSSKYTDKA
jgi:hypothetical protein